MDCSFILFFAVVVVFRTMKYELNDEERMSARRGEKKNDSAEGARGEAGVDVRLCEGGKNASSK